MTRFLLLLSFCSLVSCGEKKNAKDSVYLAGEIVNPTNDYVVLFRNDQVVDSAKLDDQNRFRFQLDNVDHGLHHFYHAPESQYIYFEKGDSILIRLNSIAFDESLIFSGSNEQVNNFMIEMFLNYEDEERLVKSFYKLAPTDFSSKIDSLRSQKMAELESLIVGEDLSENAFAMAKASIDYNSFLYKEKYPFFHKKTTQEDNIHELTSNFYEYRKNLDFNNKNLTYFRPYYDFMLHHFGNLSYMACAKDCGMEKYLDKKNHLHLNRHKMALIDSVVNEKYLKNNLLRNLAVDYLLKAHEISDEADRFITEFETLSTNKEHKEEVALLYDGIKILQRDYTIPNLQLEGHNGTTVSLHEIALKKPNTVFYFWTATQKIHFKNVRKHLSKLRKTHPDFAFVGINLRTSKQQWLGLLEEHQLDTNNHYRSANFEKLQKTLLVDNLHKCIITKDTLIVDAFGHLYQNFSDTKKALASK